METFLETGRLVLRRFTPDDVQNLFDLDSDREVMRHINGGEPTSYETVKNEVLPRFLGYYRRSDRYGFWAIVEKKSGHFIGWFHLKPSGDGPSAEAELGYRLKRRAWGKGYATEGSKALLEKSFQEFGLDRVVATALPENAASIRVLEKAGFRFETRFVYRNAGSAWADGREAVRYALSGKSWKRRGEDR